MTETVDTQKPAISALERHNLSLRTVVGRFLLPDSVCIACYNRFRSVAFKRTLAGFFIASIAVFSYLGVYYNDFLSLDDYDYVVGNEHIKQGIRPQSVKWAFTVFHSTNWHPLTWISHMADWQLYGNRPGGHHLTNVALHAANTVLLFLLLAYMTGFTGRSAMVALFFAVHPLHVESVAWIAERKDVLCAFFWLLTLFCYAWYVRKPSWRRFGLVIAGFACALMSKPMAVTLPFTLLLLDYWPLRRAAGRSGADKQRLSVWKRLLAEKWPLYVMAIISCVVTFCAQRGAVVTLETIPLWARAGNAAMSYWQYIAKMFWPDPLVVFYYHEMKDILFPFALLLAVMLLMTTAGFWLVRKKMPFCMTGWLWYCGTLVPVIGIVQVGKQAMADRYTYIPLIGLFLALVWGVAELVSNRPRFRSIMFAVSAAAIGVLTVKTIAQVNVWQNDITLFSQILAHDPRGDLPNLYQSVYMHARGKPHEAKKYFERAKFFNAVGDRDNAFSEFCALQEKDSIAARLSFDREISMAPNRYQLLKATAEFHAAIGRPADAEAYYRRLVAIAPDSIDVHSGLGQALSEQNKLVEAEREYREVIAKDTVNVGAYNRLGVVLTNRQLFDKAIAAFRRSLELKPAQSLTYANIGRTYLLQGRFPDAVRELSEAVRLKPEDAVVHYDLGRALFAWGDYKLARMHYCRAIELNPGFEEARISLKVLENRQSMKPEQQK
jgi:protein O-mannosyl-transferase